MEKHLRSAASANQEKEILKAGGALNYASRRSDQRQVLDFHFSSGNCVANVLIDINACNAMLLT